MLTLRHLRKQFAAARAGAPAPLVLDDLSLDIPNGAIFTLLGPSGCGKTTLLRLIAGLETPDQGQIHFQDQTWVDTTQGVFLPPQRRGLGLVFQSYAVWPHLSVFDNVAYPLRHQRLTAAQVRQQVLATLARVGLEGLEQRAPHQLSGGQQQRVAMARALVNQPRLLLLDEPFSNLDAGLRQRLRLELRGLQQQLGLTVVLVTHDQEDAFALSDHIAVLKHGRVEQIGTPEALHDAPGSAYVHGFVGRSSCLQAVVDDLHSPPQARLGQQRIALPETSATLAAGTPVQLHIRPQDIRLQPLQERHDGLHATIRHRVFAGAHYDTYLELPDGQQLLARLPRDADWRPGQQVSIALQRPPFVSTAVGQPLPENLQ